MSKKQVRINISSVANVSAVRKEKRNGRDVLIVPSATLPDDVIMNGIKYPASEIASSFASLNRKPAPFGHPTINGQFVSASDPEGINIGYIGAWNENARQKDGRVFLDKVIDVEVANRSKDGKAVIDAINEGKPVHTSTGLLCMLDSPDEGAKDHKHNAREIYFDHDAILLNEEGAATPDQGVGMLVNKATSPETGEEIEVINSSLDDAMRDLDWAVDSAVRAVDKLEKQPFYERIKAALLEIIISERTTPAINGDADMTDKVQFDELSAKVNDLTGKMDKIDETIANAVTGAIKPLTDDMATTIANQKAKDDAELTALVNSIVEAGIMDEGPAKELTLNAARALAPTGDGKAATVNGKGKPKGKEDEFKDVNLNSDLGGKKDE